MNISPALAKKVRLTILAEARRHAPSLPDSFEKGIDGLWHAWSKNFTPAQARIVARQLKLKGFTSKPSGSRTVLTKLVPVQQGQVRLRVMLNPGNAASPSGYLAFDLTVEKAEATWPDALHAKGYIKLGEGGEGSVWRKGTATFKVIDCTKDLRADTSHCRFIHWVSTHPNPHYLRVISSKRVSFEGSTLRITEMEPLIPVPKRTAVYVDLLCDKIEGARLFDPRDAGDMAEATKVCGPDLAALLATVSTFELAIRALLKSGTGSLDELREEDNVMQRRDGTLVISDA